MIKRVQRNCSALHSHCMGLAPKKSYKTFVALRGFDCEVCSFPQMMPHAVRSCFLTKVGVPRLGCSTSTFRAIALRPLGGCCCAGVVADPTTPAVHCSCPWTAVKGPPWVFWACWKATVSAAAADMLLAWPLEGIDVGGPGETLVVAASMAFHPVDRACTGKLSAALLDLRVPEALLRSLEKTLSFCCGPFCWWCW